MPGQKKSDKVEEGAKIGPRGQNGPSALEITVAGVWTAAAPCCASSLPRGPGQAGAGSAWVQSSGNWLLSASLSVCALNHGAELAFLV